MPTSHNSRPANQVQTIARVMLILDTLAQYPQGLGLGNLAQNVDLPKGTTHRLISSLAHFDLVRQDPYSKHYMLGFKLVELGNVLLDQVDLRNEARPIILDLAEKVQETIHLVIRDHHKALYIDKVNLYTSGSGLQMVSRLGSHIPLHCSSVGKVLMAYLPEDLRDDIIHKTGLQRRTNNTITDPDELKAHLQKVRRQGFAIDNEENEKGIRCVAAPIRDESGSVTAAISISGPATRISLENIHHSLKGLVCETAIEISRKLGFRGA